MKKLSLFILFTLLTTFSYGQKMAIESFVELPQDLTARTKQRKDINDVPAALIRVAIVLQGVEFDQSIGQPDHVTGEYLVYMPAGSKRLTIRHEKYIPETITFADYGIERLESLCTYRLTITLGSSAEEPKLRGGNFLVMKINPISARVSIDNGEGRPVGMDGMLTEYLPNGNHTYRVEAEGYFAQSGNITMFEERQEIDINLVSSKATLSVRTETQGAMIYINESFKGVNQCKGEFIPSTYLVEAKKEGYRTASVSVTLEKQQQKEIIIPALQPIYGSLRVDYDVDADVYLDDELLGKAPNIFSDILIGKHQLKICKKGYQNHIETLTIIENKQTELKGKLSKEVTKAEDKQLTQNQSLPQKKSRESIRLGSYDDLVGCFSVDYNFNFSFAHPIANSLHPGLGSIDNHVVGFTLGYVRLFGGYVNMSFGVGESKSAAKEFQLNTGITDDFSLFHFSISGGGLFCIQVLPLYFSAGIGYIDQHYEIEKNGEKEIFPYADALDDGVLFQVGIMGRINWFTLSFGVDYGLGVTSKHDILGFRFGIGMAIDN